MVRAGELGLIVIAAAIGVLAGLAVTGMSLAAQGMHELIFRLPDGERLSGTEFIPSHIALLAPIVGGALLGVLLFASARWRKRVAVDPIEANALHGGRMSLTDSLLVALQNLISNGFGASVGLEAGYTQISSGIASRVGLAFEMRRGDMRTLVGCGAAAAIATAFNAPLTGAFYAFELIIGTYSIATLTPVVVAALCGTFTARLIVGRAFLIDVGSLGAVVDADYAAAFGLGVVCAGFGILVMQGVTLVESLARRSVVPPALRPLIGGAAVGALALVSPQVLSAGHGALHLNLDTAAAPAALLALILLKSVASAISIGSGFRGGLFFASLFLGALIGKLYAALAPFLFHTATLTPVVYAIVGMSALAVAIIGGPLTMTFLALELTGDFPITVLVLVAVVASSVTVRKTFGYSFATWRFHLRGENIRSAHDVGWIRTLTVGQMMRRDPRIVRDDTTVAMLRRKFPLGSGQRVVVVDQAERYAGIVLIPEAFDAALDQAAEATRLDTLLHYRDQALTPEMNAKEAMAVFDRTESEALAVVDGSAAKRVIGLLTESHTLRRYSEELDRRRREVSGEI
ncbi:CIC family chloride channel protein [Labrys wisconsinensis]|uniref:CIC family chloride channel protein n=2 Tax=Labrys wisconsinensis TaxID=425677 RepID=A0ABU0JMA1_9HYPH|nr:CIC family chloride channel protein [Labrys wisconsinensis]